MKVRVFKPMNGQVDPLGSDYYFEVLPTPGQSIVTLDNFAWTDRIVEKVGYVEADRDFLLAVWLHPEGFDPT